MITDVLLVPIRNGPDIVSLQGIFPPSRSHKNGRKQYLSGGMKKGCYFKIGGYSETDGIGTIVVCEGFATGASIFEATGLQVLVAFDAGNLLPVAQMARANMDRAGVTNGRILIAGDNDQWGDSNDNPGVRSAAEAAEAVSGTPGDPEIRVRRDQAD